MRYRIKKKGNVWCVQKHVFLCFWRTMRSTYGGTQGFCFKTKEEAYNQVLKYGLKNTLKEVDNDYKR